MDSPKSPLHRAVAIETFVNNTNRVRLIWVGLAKGVYMADTRVFISYAFVNEQHPDYLFVEELARDLRQAGVGVIIDTTNVGEQAFVHRLNTVLPGCQWMIVVLTPEALQSLRLQMSVSSAMNLLSEKKIRDIFVLAALPTDSSKVPTSGSAPNSITAAREGSLWFTERISGIIGQFVP